VRQSRFLPGNRDGFADDRQFRRIAIHRGLLDLDRESSESVLQLLKLLNEQQGKTIVMVTHDPRAASYATRRLFVDKGELIDSPSEVAA
jgi:ABC-type ATPase involved in cell division